MAIVIAALTGYGFLVFQSLDGMVRDLVDRANRLTERHGLGIAFVDPEINLGGLTSTELIQNMQAVAIGNAPLKVSDQLTLTKQDAALRGKYFVLAMERVSASYPFTNYDGNVVDEKTIRKWVVDLGTALQGLFFAFDSLEHYGAGIVEAADRVADRLVDEAIAQIPEAKDRIEESRGQYTRSVDEHRRLDAYVRQQDIEIRVQLDRMRKYRERVIPSPRTRDLIGIAVLLGFVCGVAVPMIHPQITSIVSAGVPVGLYTDGLLVGFVYARRKITQQS